MFSARPRRRACPPLIRLLTLTEAEAPWRERGVTLLHVLRCSSCRRTLMLLHHVYATVRAEDELYAAWSGQSMPEGAYVRFRTRLHAQEREFAEVSVTRRTRRWLPAVAVSALMLTTLALSRTHVAVLQADELLRRAVLSQQGAPPVERKLRFQFSPANAGPGAPSPIVRFRHLSAGRDRTVDDVLTALPASWMSALASSPFQPEDLLRADRFGVWCRQSGVRVAPVTRATNGALIRASSDAGPIRFAELLVAADGSRVYRVSIAVDRLGVLDVEEVERRPALLAADASSPGDASVEPSDITEGLERDELAVRAALHNLGLAPIGDLTLARGGQGITLTGRVPFSGARQRLMNLAANRPRVALSLSVGPPSGHPDRVRAGSWLAGRLAQAFDGEEKRQRFVRSVDQRLAAVALQVHALEELSRRYPLAAEGARSTDLERGVASLSRRQGQDLQNALMALRSDLSALVGATSQHLARPTRHDLRPVAGDARHHLLALEAQWQLARSATTSDLTSGEGASVALRTAFAALWDVVYKP